jgi:hypothetical protein
MIVTGSYRAPDAGAASRHAEQGPSSSARCKNRKTACFEHNRLCIHLPLGVDSGPNLSAAGVADDPLYARSYAA